jgi:hypothetical protein
MVGWIVLLVVVLVIVIIGLAVLLTQLPDIRRYRRIRTM